MQQDLPRIVLAGTHSGCGKTTVTCSILQALQDRGLRVAGFKCGPDYIDPMFHRKVIGTPTANLDLFFFDDNTVRVILAQHGAESDIGVIEGVMGYYDGRGAVDPTGSTFDIAHRTDSPTVLTVDAKGASLSVLATIRGFDALVCESGICGVILNRCSPALYEALSREIERRFDGRIRPLGYLPEMKDCTLMSRRLGLVSADEVCGLRDKLRALARQAETTIDLDGLLALAGKAAPISYEPPVFRRFEADVRIAVARDKAFCFYYEDSLSVLERMGATLVGFSPLRDRALPRDVHGLILGGGYPELHARELSGNVTMLQSISSAVTGGLPCIAECGGYMVLTQSIDGHPMAGVLPGHCGDRGRLVRFGYARITAIHDNLLCRAGESIAAHEFHYWDHDQNGDDFEARKPSGKTWSCAYAGDTLYAGFPHFHFLSEPRFAEHFYEACLKEKHRHDRDHTPGRH